MLAVFVVCKGLEEVSCSAEYKFLLRWETNGNYPALKQRNGVEGVYIQTVRLRPMFLAVPTPQHTSLMPETDKVRVRGNRT